MKHSAFDSQKGWHLDASLWLLVSLSSLFLILAGWFLHERYHEFRRNAERNAMLNAASIAASLQGQNLGHLLQGQGYVDENELARLRDRLMRSVAINPLFRYAAVYIEEQGSVLIIVDSEPQDSEFHRNAPYSYDDADPMFLAVLQNGVPILTEGFDQGGETWKFILIPFVESQGNRAFGALAVAVSEKTLYSDSTVNTWRLLWILLLSWVFFQVAFFLYRSYQHVLLNRSELQKANTQLLDIKEDLSLLVSQMPQALALHEIICNDKGLPVDYRFLKINPKFTEVTGLREEVVLGKRVLQVLPDTESYWIEQYGKVALSGQALTIEQYSVHFDRWFEVHVYSPKRRQFITIFEDITNRREREREIEYLNFHDRYTGFFNRKAFELYFSEYDTRRMYPLTIVLFDINNLKAVNDTLGHEIGDLLIWQLSDCIKEASYDASWIAARLDGDDFGLLLPFANKQLTEQVAEHILVSYERKNVGNQYGSVSWGSATKHEHGIGFEGVLRLAEDDLFEHKLAENASSRQQTIDVLLQALFSKSPREKEHSNRVSRISAGIARKMGLPSDQVEMIRVAGIMHDIGKVAIDDTILNKPGKLDDQQWKEMKRHSEIGFHLLSSVSRYSIFAKDVLAHHEKWDGSGYPRGLKGEQIPLAARIIAVADAFDAMLCERPYRKPVSVEEAKEELLRCCDSHFDAQVVHAFLQGAQQE